MLRLGLLGCDPEIAVIAEAADRRGDRIVAAWPAAAALPDGLDVPRIGGWEPLLDAAVCDAVLVGSAGWGDATREAVRTLVQAGRPLVLAQPLEVSMLWAYELDMIRRDTGGILLPHLPARLHPFVARLRTTLEAALGGVGDLGPAESLQLERRMADRSKTAVLAELSRDADLVRAIVGDPARLSTLGSAEGDAAWTTLAVGFTGPAQVPARWQVAPAGDPGLTVRLQAARGVITVEAPDDPRRPWTWNGGHPDSAAFDPGGATLVMLEDALAGRREPAAPVAAATWADAARAIELAETVPRSLARGRGIDLHREEFTDLGTFRGTMASLGCGLIMAALLVVIAATVVAGVAREFGWQIVGGLADSWPMLVLAVLGAFLALQLIPLVLGGADRDPGPHGRT